MRDSWNIWEKHIVTFLIESFVLDLQDDEATCLKIDLNWNCSELNFLWSVLDSFFSTRWSSRDILEKHIAIFVIENFELDLRDENTTWAKIDMN